MHLCQTHPPPNLLASTGLNWSKRVLISCHLTITHIHLFLSYLSPHPFWARFVFVNSGCFAFRMSCRRSSLGVSRAPSGCIFGVANLFGYCVLVLYADLVKLPYWSCEIFFIPFFFTLFLFHIGHFGVFYGWVHDTFFGNPWDEIYIPSSLMKSISFTFPIGQLVGFDLLRSDLGVII